jgi:hypothetical protein
MGNIFSSKKTVVEDNEDTPTEYDMNLYKEKRERLFYGTILVCILYAIFAFILLVASYLSPKIKYLLLDKFLPFTSIYIIGTILIILFLVTQIFDYKPIKHDRTNNYEDLSCPDYWTLETIPVDEYTKTIFDSNVNYNLFKYRCKLNNNIFNKYDIYNANSANYNITNLNSGLLNDSKADKPKDSTINNYNNMHLYTNINNNDNYNLIKSNFPEGSNVVYGEIVKNSLLMNNYEISADNSNNTIYKPKLTTDTMKNLSLNINKINFNPDLADNGYYNANNGQTTITFDNESINTIRNIDYKNLLIKYNFSTVKKDKCELSSDGNCYTLGLYSSKVRTNNFVGHIYLDSNYKFNNFIQYLNISLNNDKHDCFITESYYIPPSTTTTSGSNLSLELTEATKTTNKKFEDILIKITVGNSSYINNGDITFNKTSRNANVNIPLVCDNVYPLFLASKDIELSKNNKNFDQNVLRCAYSKLCNVPWSDLNCDKYNNN